MMLLEGGGGPSVVLRTFDTEVDAFVKQHQVYLDCTEEDLVQDRQAPTGRALASDSGSTITTASGRMRVAGAVPAPSRYGHS